MADSLDLFYEILSYVVDVLSGLSIGGALLTIVTFTVFKEIRTYPIKLIVYLCVSIFLAQTFFIVAFYVYDSFMCIPSALMIHFFFLTNFFWSFCIAFNFYQMIVRRNREAERLEKWYHVGCWSLAFVIVVIMSGFDKYGDIGGVCYMKSPLAIFGAFFLPGLIVVSANVVIFFFISREIHDTMSQAPQADKREKKKEFRVYISIFISIGLSWIFGFLMTVFPADGSDEGVIRAIFLVLFSLSTPLQGFLIFVSYCANAKVLSRWAALLGQWIPFFKQFENMGSSLSTGRT